MNRLIENTVFSGFVIACRLATCPTRISPSFVNATTDGVSRLPSWFGMTVGSPPSMTATTEFVVPKSIPITFAIPVLLTKNLYPDTLVSNICNHPLSGSQPLFLQFLLTSWGFGDRHQSGPQQAAMEKIRRAVLINYRIGRHLHGLSLCHCFMVSGIERFAFRRHAGHPVLF